MYAYCLFCETQRCKIIAENINLNSEYQCISPQIIQRKWVKGVPTDESHDWLPGYLFLYSPEMISPRFNISGIIRCLGNGELHGQDLRFAELIYEKKGIMGTIPLIREGNRCRISDPAWKEVSGEVIKMDHERKRCCVAFSFDGIARKIWVGYEYADPEPE